MGFLNNGIDYHQALQPDGVNIFYFKVKDTMLQRYKD